MDKPKVTVCGSFRKHPEQLHQDYQLLSELCDIISPIDLQWVAEDQGFVYAEHELNIDPEAIENKHLQAILQADLVWLHCPDGYLGVSAALELGYATAHGIPVFAHEQPREQPGFRGLVQLATVEEAAASISAAKPVPDHGLMALQKYYSQLGKERGWDSENARDTMLLMIEELGELARAIRKEHGLTRDRGYQDGNVAEELADIQMYLLQLANLLQIDLGEAVEQKVQVLRARTKEAASPAAR